MLICKIVGVSRRAVNDKLKKNNLFVTRKVRKDAISHSPLVCALVWDSYQKSTGTYGQRRVHQDIINKGINIVWVLFLQQWEDVVYMQMKYQLKNQNMK